MHYLPLIKEVDVPCVIPTSYQRSWCTLCTTYLLSKKSMYSVYYLPLIKVAKQSYQPFVIVQNRKGSTCQDWNYLIELQGFFCWPTINMIFLFSPYPTHTMILTMSVFVWETAHYWINFYQYILIFIDLAI